MNYPRSNHKAELAAHLPHPAGLVVLDVGCGDGAMTRYLASLGANAIGIETDDGQLARARAAEPVNGASYQVGRGESLPFADGAVDAVLYFNSLHHLPAEAMAPALAEAARILAAGGLLLVVEPLAEGLYFETLRPLEDETEVRAAAIAALEAPPATLGEAGETFYLNTVRFRDVEQFLAAAVAPDPARAHRMPLVEDLLRERFARHGRPTLKGIEFDQPMRLNTLRKR